VHVQLYNVLCIKPISFNYCCATVGIGEIWNETFCGIRRTATVFVADGCRRIIGEIECIIQINSLKNMSTHWTMKIASND